MKDMKETIMKYVFLVCACASILAVILICAFLFANGVPAIGKIGVFNFLLGETWKPGNDLYGILPFILGSIYVTAGRSHRTSDSYFYGKVLPEIYLQIYEACS